MTRSSPEAGAESDRNAATVAIETSAEAPPEGGSAAPSPVSAEDFAATRRRVLAEAIERVDEARAALASSRAAFTKRADAGEKRLRRFRAAVAQFRQQLDRDRATAVELSRKTHRRVTQLRRRVDRMPRHRTIRRGRRVAGRLVVAIFTIGRLIPALLIAAIAITIWKATKS